MLDKEPNELMTFKRAVELLAVELIEVKNIPFSSLINQHFSIPADRVVKFIKLLKTDLVIKQ